MTGPSSDEPARKPARPAASDKPATTAAGRAARARAAARAGARSTTKAAAKSTTTASAKTTTKSTSSTTAAGSAIPSNRATRGRGGRPETRRADTDRERRVPAARPARPRRRPTRRRVLFRRWVALLVALGVFGVALALLFTPLLGVRGVDVSGLQSLTADQVRAAAQVPGGSPMLTLDTGDIAGRVGRLSRVARVSVYRQWPGTVLVDVTERVPVGVLAEPDGSHLIDRTGYDFATVAQAPAGLPVIQLTTVEPGDARTQAVVAVLTALPVQLRDLVVAIGAQTAGSVQLALSTGKTVRWGSADDSAHKAAVLGALLTQPGKTYDVSAPDLPTIS